jgi:hypothetical protein
MFSISVSEEITMHRFVAPLAASLLLVASASLALAAHPVFDPSAAPNGTHVQTGTPGCTVNEITLAVTCNEFELAGVGNANAEASLIASYSATVDCTNKGGKLVPVKSTLQSAPASTGVLEPKNGRLTIPQLSVSPPSDAAFLAAATCPNGNWTKSLAGGTATLDSWVYTVSFVGFTGNYLTISSHP